MVKMYKKLLKSAAILSLIGASAMASSAVIVDQGPISDVQAFQPSASDPATGFQSVLDDFSLSAETNITKLIFWTNEDPLLGLNTLEMSVRIYADTVTSVNDDIWSFSGIVGADNSFTKTAVDGAAGALFMHELDVSDLLLGAGNYFINLGGVLSMNSPVPVIGWTVSDIGFGQGVGQVETAFIGQDFARNPAVTGVDLAFRIIGEVDVEVPVNAPLSTALLCVLVGGVFLRRKSQ